MLGTQALHDCRSTKTLTWSASPEANPTLMSSSGSVVSVAAASTTGTVTELFGGSATEVGAANQEAIVWTGGF
ncbi:MAG: hypothetical protein ABSF69_18025 [Polyangiaceae bacterium]|jgi:hypothetical protein